MHATESAEVRMTVTRKFWLNDIEPGNSQIRIASDGLVSFAAQESIEAAFRTPRAWLTHARRKAARFADLWQSPPAAAAFREPLDTNADLRR